MRRLLVVLVWALSTAGVAYVANAAVELVDLQVFPEGASIRVLERAGTSVPEAEPLVESAALTSTTTSLVPVVSTTTSLVPSSPITAVDPGAVEVRSGSSYQARVAAGGSPPYEWKVISGSLPVGLELTDAGFVEGTVEGSGRFQASLQVTDTTGQTATVATTFVVRQYKVVRARGGSATVVVTGDSVGFFSALHGDGFESTQVLRPGPIVVEVAFLPISGDDISWIRCEVVGEVSCTHD